MRWRVAVVLAWGCVSGPEPVDADDTDVDTDAGVDTDTDVDTDGVHTDPPDTDDSDPPDTDMPPDTGEPGHSSTLEATTPVVCLDPEDRTSNPSQVVLIDTPAPPRRGLTGGASVLADLDGDGDLDVVGVLHDRVAVWAQIRPRVFSLTVPFRLEAAGVDAGLVGGSAVDLEGDGDLDLLITGRGVRRALLRNDGPGTFTDVTEGSGLELVPERRGLMGHAWSDVDADGDLDLVIGGHGPLPADVDPTAPGDGQDSHLFLNDGAGRFTDASTRLPASVQRAWTTQPVFFDPDGDGDDDLFLPSDFGAVVEPSRLLWNDGGTFRLDGGAFGLDLAMNAAGAVAGDVDGDGAEDLLVLGRRRVALHLSSQGFADVAEGRGLIPEAPSVLGWGASLADLDNDGRLDAAAAFGEYEVAWDTNPSAQPDRLWVQESGGSFVDQRAQLGLGSVGPHRNAHAADLDRDGWLDVVSVGLDGSTKIGFAHCGESSWLRVSLRQPGPNPFAVGATITVREGTRTWVRRIRAGGSGFGVGDPPEVHVGLGAVRVVDELVVRWPDGTEERWRGVLARRGLTIRR